MVRSDINECLRAVFCSSSSYRLQTVAQSTDRCSHNHNMYMYIQNGNADNIQNRCPDVSIRRLSCVRNGVSHRRILSQPDRKTRHSSPGDTDSRSRSRMPPDRLRSGAVISSVAGSSIRESLGRGISAVRTSSLHSHSSRNYSSSGRTATVGVPDDHHHRTVCGVVM